MLRSPLASKASVQEGERRMRVIQLGSFSPFQPDRKGQGPSCAPNPRVASRATEPRLFKD
jgi:hypothetical protein